MRFFLLLILFVSSASLCKTCGWTPDDDAFYFYNLFKQTNISDTIYFSFLRDDDNYFHSYQKQEVLNDKGNLNLWSELLPHWKRSNLRKALTTSSKSEFEDLWQGKQTAIDVKAKKYMQYARKCSNFFNYRDTYSWNYIDIVNKNNYDSNDILGQGIILFDKETNKQLQLRYAYQIVRIFHYSKLYNDAVNFFTDNIESRFPRNEIYYYLLDQIAGCYFSLKEYEKAAYYFLNVFNYSVDRKKSAFLSYHFCTKKGAEGKEYFIDISDKKAYITLKSLRTFSDDLAGIKELLKLDSKAETLELLFMRAINNIERKIWPTRIGLKSDELPSLTNEVAERIRELKTIAQSVYSINGIKNKQFWLISSSYLHFLSHDYTSALVDLNQVTNSQFKTQKDILNCIYEVFSWQSIANVNENYLYPILVDVINSEPINDWNTLLPAWKYVIMDHVGHLYYKSGEIGKAYLMHNRIDVIGTISSKELIDGLITLIKKKKKTRFEMVLLNRTKGIKNTSSAIDYLEYIKGIWFLQHGKPHEALRSFNKLHTDIEKLSRMISAKIFSNNIKECFSCPENEVMVDSVFLAPVFSFIKPRFNLSVLCSNLIKLDSMTHQENKRWKRKLAHYLLANYYFNISNTGYYRGLFVGQSNCCNYRYFNGTSAKHKTASECIQNSKGYNLMQIATYYKSYFELQKLALKHYDKVIEYSVDKELNARCLYMMAKCELNSMYNESKHGYYNYDGSVTKDNANFKDSFQQLISKYEDTKFYQMIIKECSFFRHYCSL